MKYAEEVKTAMALLASHPKTIFLGQSVAYKGNAIHTLLADLPAGRKIEMPVFEQSQMGMSIGLALEGFIPVSVFPRFNFLLLAMDQLVNHLDKIRHLSHGALTPKVIIKTMVGSVRPLDPGIQHQGNFVEAFRALHMEEVVIEDLLEPEEIVPAYRQALERDDGKSTILIEYGDFYNDK
jgi:pyruvate/2-oxoglutarate/acetoin dehydrogenase E1 component